MDNRHSHSGDTCTIKVRNVEWDGMKCVERRNDTRLSISVGNLLSGVSAQQYIYSNPTSAEQRQGRGPQQQVSNVGRTCRMSGLSEYNVIWIWNIRYRS